MNKDVIATFKELGFKVKKISEDVYGLTFEVINLILKEDPKDENFIDVRTVFDISAMTTEAAYELANKLNVRLKFIKFYVYDNNLWASCEKQLRPNEDVKAVIQDIVYCMVNAMHFYTDLTQGNSEMQVDAS